MDRALTNSLMQLGCNEKHIRFYRANLELGIATLLDIAKKARLQRSTTYVIASELVAMGLVNEDHKTYKKLFVAADPDIILQKLEAKHRQVGRSGIAFKEVLPELRAMHQTTLVRPRVRTFEGRQGLIAVWKDVLAEQQEILLWTNQEAEARVFGENTHDLFIKERRTKNIPMRALAVRNEKGRALMSNDGADMRRTKLLPPSVWFTSETYIYGSKVAILDIGADIFGVITENEQIAASHRAMFELAWSQA